MIQLRVLFEHSVKRRLRRQIKPFIRQSRYDLGRWQALILPFIARVQNGRFFSVSELVWLHNALRLRALVLCHSAVSASPAFQRALAQLHQIGRLVAGRATGNSFVIVV
jgi:hypothetical protein